MEFQRTSPFERGNKWEKIGEGGQDGRFRVSLSWRKWELGVDEIGDTYRAATASANLGWLLPYAPMSM